MKLSFSRIDPAHTESFVLAARNIIIAAHAQSETSAAAESLTLFAQLLAGRKWNEAAELAIELLAAIHGE